MKRQHFKRTFDERMSFPTEPAEEAFETWAGASGVAFHRLGLNRPPFEYLRQLAPFLLATPDYLVETQEKRFDGLTDYRGYKTRHVLVECKGVGADQEVKLKHDNLVELAKWEEVSGRPVALFVYDSSRGRASGLLPLGVVSDLTKEAPTGTYFDNNKTYYRIPTDWIETWESVPEDEA